MNKVFNYPIKNFLAIRTRTASLICFAVIVLVGGLGTEYLVGRAKKDALKEAEIGFSFLVDRVNQKMKESDQIVRLLASSPEVLSGLQSEDSQDIKKINRTLDHYSRFFDNTTAYILNPQGIIIAASGRKLSDRFLGKNYSLKPYFQDAVQGRPGSYFIFEKDSEKRGCFSAYPLKDSQGRLLGVAVVKKEIDALSKSFQQFQNVFLVDPQGIIFLSSIPKLVRTSLEAFRGDQANNFAFLRRVTPNSPERSDFLDTQNGKRIVFDNKQFIFRKNPIQIPGWSIIFLTPAGRIDFYRFFGIMITVSLCFLFALFVFSTKALKRSAQETQEQFVKLYRAVEQSPSTVVITDVEGHIEYVNPKFCQLTGYSAEEAQGQNPRILKSDKQSPEVYQQLWETLLKGQEWRGEFCNKKKNGDLYWEFASISPVRDERGKTTHYVAVKEDITARKEAEEKAREAVRTKSEFISIVSHELRTPLTAIKEGISIVVDKVTGELNKEQEEFLNVAKRNVDRLARLINDVLDFQKLDTKQMVFDCMPQRIAPIIREAVESMRKNAEKENIELRMDIPEHLPKIKCDRDRIIQVVINLLSNAIKYANGKPVWIEAREQNNIIQVSVTDQGEGIQEEEFPKLFQTFSQLKKGKERKTGSTGLGLAICRKIIDDHGGKIWVESRLGEGSIFSFVLPIEERRQK